MSKNVPPEIELLRRVAAAARWAIDANNDDPVGKDGRSRVGVNWVMAQGELASALTDFEAAYDHVQIFNEKRAHAARIENQLGRGVRIKP